MTRRDGIWVGVRLFGVYIAFLALRAVPNIVVSGSYAISYHEPRRGESEAALMLNKMREMYTNNFFEGSGRFIVYGLLAWYLLRSLKIIDVLSGSPAQKED
jgi:hypothetical protein